MKCVHCNGEHPDGFKFCPVTGKEIVQPFKACTNPECGAFGKYILPVDAKFCAKCGTAIKNGNAREDTCVEKSIVKTFFPMYGVTLGKTTVDDVDERFVGEGEYEGTFEYRPSDSDTRFVILQGQDCFSVVFIEEGEDMPKKFSECGFEWRMKPKNIRKLLKKYDLIIQDNADFEKFISDDDDLIAAKSQDSKLLIFFILDCYSELTSVFIELAINGGFQFINKRMEEFNMESDNDDEEDNYDNDDEEVRCPVCGCTVLEPEDDGFWCPVCEEWYDCDEVKRVD